MVDIHNPLEYCKLASLAAQNENFSNKLDFDVEYAGAIYQADTNSFNSMTQALAQEPFPDAFYWVDKANNKVPMTKSQLQELSALVFAKRFELFDAHQNRKNRLRIAASIEELFVDIDLPNKQQ
jgi:hypothetical protein